MKKVLIPLIAFLALTVSVNAQDKMGKKGQHHRGKHGHEMMAKQLNFTDAQKAQVKTINDDSRKKMQELKKNESITVKEQRDRKAAIAKERKTKMDGLLTAEQKAKQTQLKAEHKAKKEASYAKHLDKMKTNLNLTDDQVAKLKSQRTANHAKAEQIKNNESLSREQKKAQMMALKTEAKDQNNKIVTAEQLKKKEEMKKAHADKGRARK
jgi:Spy/CpxP family protein refolding chaperone